VHPLEYRFMNGPMLLQYGDDREREGWPAVQQYFRLYEEFWRLHIVPLRGTDG